MFSPNKKEDLLHGIVHESFSHFDSTCSVLLSHNRSAKDQLRTFFICTDHVYQ